MLGVSNLVLMKLLKQRIHTMTELEKLKEEAANTAVDVSSAKSATSTIDSFIIAYNKLSKYVKALEAEIAQLKTGFTQ